MIRHGESHDNVNKVYGSDETSLSKRGINQIKKAKENLKEFSYDKVYYSPLVRTTETLEHLDLEGEADIRIRELNFGIFAGKDYKTIEKEFPKKFKMWNEDIFNYSIPNGESILENYKRVKDFLEDIIKKDEDVLLVTHAGVIRLVFSWVFENPEYFFKFKVTNGSINIVSVEEDYKFIKKINYNPRIKS